MKYIIFSDLHNNYFALREFYNYLSDISGEFKLYFLGDIIGYYKFDVRTIELLKIIISKWKMEISIGNHDAAFFNYLGLTQFHVRNSKSLEETIRLNYEHRDKIIEIFHNINLDKINIEIENMAYILSHGGISDIINDYYYPDLKFIKINKYKFDSGINYICGHTHIPFEKRVNDNVFTNVGSIGMPRDGDPRMCFLEIENSEFRFIRKFYDMDSLYTYNRQLSNNVKNRIYTGGKSKFIDMKLLDVCQDEKYVGNNFTRYYVFEKAIYICYNDCLFQILKFNQNRIRYLLRFSLEEILFDNIEDIVRRIKNENY